MFWENDTVQLHVQVPAWPGLMFSDFSNCRSDGGEIDDLAYKCVRACSRFTNAQFATVFTCLQINAHD